MQFYVIFNDGGKVLVQASDKYEAIEKAKELCWTTKTGVKEVTDNMGKPV